MSLARLVVAAAKEQGRTRSDVALDYREASASTRRSTGESPSMRAAISACSRLRDEEGLDRPGQPSVA
jgi:hypothetical protein